MAFVCLGLVGAAGAIGGLEIAAAVAVGIIGLYVVVRRPGVLFAVYLLIPFYKAAAQPYSPVDLTVLCWPCWCSCRSSRYSSTVSRELSRQPAFSRGWCSDLCSSSASFMHPTRGLAVDDTITYASAGARAAGDRRTACRITTALHPRVPHQLSRAGPHRGHPWGHLSCPILLDLSVLGENTIQTSRAALLVPILTALPRISEQVLDPASCGCRRKRPRCHGRAGCRITRPRDHPGGAGNVGHRSLLARSTDRQLARCRGSRGTRHRIRRGPVRRGGRACRQRRHSASPCSATFVPGCACW